MDFAVTRKLFFDLFAPDVGDKYYFEFTESGIRWRDRGRPNEDDQDLWEINDKGKALGNLDWPTTLSSAVRWAEFVRGCRADEVCYGQISLICCDLPEYLPKMLEADSFNAARAVLSEALEAAKSDWSAKDEVLQATPRAPVQARYIAQQACNQAYRKINTIRECESALVAEFLRSQRDDRLAELKRVGLDRVRINYPAFLRLTTFSKESHLNGEHPLYAERKEHGLVVEIHAGSFYDDLTPGVIDSEHLTLAEAAANASLRFDTDPETVLNWIFEQGGEVDFRDDWLNNLEEMAAEQGPSISGAESVAGENQGEREETRRPRMPPKRQAILEALKGMDAESSRDPRELERGVRAALIAAANAGGTTYERDYDFRVQKGELLSRHGDRWVECTKQSLKGLIKRALPHHHPIN